MCLKQGHNFLFKLFQTWFGMFFCFVQVHKEEKKIISITNKSNYYENKTPNSFKNIQERCSLGSGDTFQNKSIREQIICFYYFFSVLLWSKAQIITHMCQTSLNPVQTMFLLPREVFCGLHRPVYRGLNTPAKCLSLDSSQTGKKETNSKRGWKTPRELLLSQVVIEKDYF